MESEVILTDTPERLLQDFDRVTLKDGECLVLRCRRPLDANYLDRINQHMRASCPTLVGRVLITSNDFDILVAALEPESNDDAVEEERLRRMQVETAYNEGRTIYAKDIVTREQYQIHRVANPETLEWAKVDYSLTPYSADDSIAPG